VSFLSKYAFFSFNYNGYNDEKYSIGNAEIECPGLKKIEIDWLSGNVSVYSHEGDKVIIREKEGLEDDFKLRYLLEDNVLTIKFLKCTNKVRPLKPKEKEELINKKCLEVILPESLKDNGIILHANTISADVFVKNVKLSDIFIKTISGDIELAGITSTDINTSTTSGDLNITDITAFDISTKSVSGDVELENVKANELFAETVSGDVSSRNLIVSGEATIKTVSGDADIYGEFNSVEGRTVSGDFEIESSKCPQKVDISTTSGDIELGIPENDGFTFKYGGKTKNLSCAFPTIIDGSSLVYKDGGAKFRCETVSGDMTIYKI